MSEIVVLSAARTPFGSFQGALAAVPAWSLGATAIRGALARAAVDPAGVSDVLMGCVLSAGQGQAPARRAALAAGLPPAVRTVTVNKVCGSGLQTVIQAAQALAAGAGTLIVAGGMENMSQAPYLLPKARDGYRLGHQQVVDSLVADGLWDPYNDISMGACAEQCAARYAFSREEQDAYAIESFRRANAAQQEGRFAGEIAPVEVAAAKGGATRVEQDEGPGKVKYDRIPGLKPSFQRTARSRPPMPRRSTTGPRRSCSPPPHTPGRRDWRRSPASSPLAATRRSPSGSPPRRSRPRATRSRPPAGRRRTSTFGR